MKASRDLPPRASRELAVTMVWRYGLEMVTTLRRWVGGYEPYEAFRDAWGEVAGAAGAEARVIGASVEGRAITAFELGARGAPAVLLTALIHGVEVIGSLALRSLVAALGRERELLDRGRFVIVPVVNPDALAANLERLRAGRPAGQRGNARRVDLNRNFPRVSPATPAHPFSGSRFRWLPHYAGPHPCSEPETRAVAALAESLRPSFALGFHSFGNLLLYPWGHSAARHPDAAYFEALGRAFNEPLGSARYGVKQASGLYPTVGDLDDWLDARFGTVAFTVEVGNLDRRLLHPRRFANPFCWMNPLDIEGTVRRLVPGLLALLRAALGISTVTERSAPRHHAPGLLAAR